MKHVIVERYTFAPSTQTVTVIGKNIRPEQLLLITNVTNNTVIYNFSDPSLGYSSYTNSVGADGLETTTVVLDYITASMSSTDALAIYVEESYQEIIPNETMRDPVDKLRVSTPQSLIDTDFEYSTQPTKWESINLCSNRSTAYYDGTQGISNTARTDLTFQGASGSYQITNVTAAGRVVTVTITNTAGLTVGTPVFITGTRDLGNADGWWLIESVTLNTNITFSVTTAPAAALFDATKTYLYVGGFFTGAAIPVTSITLNGTTATVVTNNYHGLQVGNGVYIKGTTGATGTLNSSWTITSVPNTSTFTFACTATGVITLAAGFNATLYARPLGYMVHRPFDGGVQFTNISPFGNYQVIRQTRRYFRYQSGKAIQFSTGSILKPQIVVDDMTSAGTVVTVTSKYPHGLLNGAIVRVSGADQTAYNGTFTVTGAPTALTFTYSALSTPSATPATGLISLSPDQWSGSSNRIGMFDSQNGFYFEYDGRVLYAVRRSSTQQIAGIVSVTAGSNTVTGTGTKFSSQLKPGDFVVIRGMSYIAASIISDTTMYLYPEYRGVTAINCTVSKTINTRWAQSEWNIDRCDGTGATRFNIDLTKMQMFYIDYTWYGAGAIRFGFKNNRGEVIYCHRIPNNNVNTEAYMRSGNLPARYETNTIPPYTNLTSTLSSAASTGATISLADTRTWPSTGNVLISAAGNGNAAVEIISYTANTANTLTIGSRALTGGNTVAQTFTFSATAPLWAELFTPQCASTVSHWGSSIIMDGRFDDDKSYIFQAGLNTATTFNAGGSSALISLRIAPTVDNGLTGLLGAREIINRMQMTLRQMDTLVTTTAGTAAFRIELILNARLGSGTFVSAGGSSLAQICTHTSNTTVTGGETIFSFFTQNGVTQQELTLVRDLGNSILGGGDSLTAPTTGSNLYPDGPDIITIKATNVSTTNGAINARISWTEAQA